MHGEGLRCEGLGSLDLEDSTPRATWAIGYINNGSSHVPRWFNRTSWSSFMRVLDSGVHVVLRVGVMRGVYLRNAPVGKDTFARGSHVGIC